MKRLIYISIISLLALPISASENDETNNSHPISDSRLETPTEKNVNNKDSLLIFPVLYYTPETEIAGGILGGYYFYPSENPDYSKPSSFTLDLQYTELKQFKGEITFDIFKSSYKERIAGAIGYSKFPSRFWGIGNHTQYENEILYSPKSYWLNLMYKILVAGNLYMGFEYEFNHKDITFSDSSDSIDWNSLTGKNGGSVSRIGFSISQDTRDHLIYPSDGIYCQGQLLISNEIIGSDFDFTSLKIDIRKYLSIFHDVVIAGQAIGSVTWGDAPFYNLSYIGGKYLIRGFYEGRYRDQDMIAIQGECRIPIWWRIGAVAFIGAAQVAESPGDFKLNDFRIAFGGGIRLLWDREQKLNIRLDVGFAEGETSLYVTIGEAF